MPITFDKKTATFHIQTPNTSYAFRLRGDYILEHLYYGKKLQSLQGVEPYDYSPSVSGAPQDAEYAQCKELVSTNVILQEYGFYGSSDNRIPSFHASYKDGSRITKMKYISHEIYDGKPTLHGLPATYTESDDEAQTLEITMKDALTGLQLIYRYTAFSNIDAITRNIEVVNNGTAPVNIERIMSFSIDFDNHDFDFIHTRGAHMRENYIERDSLVYGGVKIESRGGCRSHDQNPFFALAEKDATESNGNVYGFSLIYSGNFEGGADVERYGATRAFMGISAFDFSWQLNPGETFTSPEAVMVYSSEGIGQMSRTFHELYRTRLARGKYRDLERPILINSWESAYFDFDEQKLVNLARQANKANIEMLVLDDGWFGHRDDDKSSLGDWYVNKNKLPDGIPGLAKKINDEGLKFGIWVEPEMISPDSDLYRAHPDWCLHVKDRGRSLFRTQLVLDLSREDVQEFILDFMRELLNSAPIEYVKWDVNRDMSEVGSALLPPSQQKEVTHRYMLGLYRVLEKLVTEFPDVLFEGCAGGGGRFDPGMMHYFTQYWTSDNSDAGDRMLIQHGTSLVMPSAFMGAHVSAVPNHQIGRTTSMNVRGLVAMGGQLGYELDVTKSTDEELLEISKQIDTYKSIRETVHKGKLYRLKSPFDSNHTVWEYISEDSNTVVLLYFKTRAVPGFERNNLRLQGLDPDADYKLKDSQLIYNGDVLMNHGLCVEKKVAPEYKKMEDFSGKLLVFEKI